MRESTSHSLYFRKIKIAFKPFFKYCCSSGFSVPFHILYSFFFGFSLTKILLPPVSLPSNFRVVVYRILPIVIQYSPGLSHLVSLACLWSHTLLSGEVKPSGKGYGRLAKLR